MLSISAIDIYILRQVHENRILWLDNTLYAFSFSTTYVSVTIILAVLYRSAYRKSRQLRANGTMFVSSFLIAIISSFVLKASMLRSRPFVTYPDIQKLSEAGSASFPSGHTTEAFTIAFATLFFLPDKRFAIPVFVWAFLVAYSRLALGVHYPTDVLAGMVLGFLAVLLVHGSGIFKTLWKKITILEK